MDESVFQAFLPELVDIRRRLHQMPETGYEERQTSALVADLMEGWGLTVTRGLAATGFVATLDRGGDRAVGLRADMDGLPIVEETGAVYASRIPGMMHACGHDGHMVLLLATAELLAGGPALPGPVHFICQPAEETGRGAEAMMADGLFDEIAPALTFGYHNWPGLPAGNPQADHRQGPAHLVSHRVPLREG